jgi:hypothetical protein
MAMAFSDTDMEDPYQVSQLLGRPIDGLVTYLTTITSKSAEDSAVKLGGAKIVLPPCLTRSKVSPKQNFGNRERFAYAIEVVFFLRQTRANKKVLATLIKRVLTDARTPASQITALFSNIKSLSKRPQRVRPITCQYGKERIQCPFEDQSECNGGDPDATPASVAIGLTQRTGKRRKHVAVEYNSDDDGEATVGRKRKNRSAPKGAKRGRVA